MLLAEVILNIPLEKTFYYIIPDGMDMDRFFRVQVNFGNKIMFALVLSIHEDRDVSAELEGIKLKEIAKVIDSQPIMDERLFRVAEWLRDFYLCTLGEAVFTIIPSAKNPRFNPLPFTFKNRLSPLSEEQAAAYRTILPSLGKPDSFYLHGITGSGKTEVYKHLVRSCLEMNKTVIILIPEIALTPQTLERFYESFGDQVAVYHSKLTPGERLGEWKRCLDGDARVLIGPRSAIFLPMQRLGLIIIDEEHESSYKSGNKPRYHARQIAFYRSRNEKATLLLGSATPQIESYYHALQGMMTLIELKQRYGESSIPEVEIIDLKEEDKGNRLLSTPLLMKMLETMQHNKQTLLFLNRRGYSPVLMCEDCGYSAQCPQCDVSMTLHKHQHLLKCHHCGYQQPIPTSCPNCQNISFKELGSGTEKLEQHLEDQFPATRIARMDLDTTKSKYRYEEILTAMKKGEIDILVGTQMIAKGHDIAGISLVGAILPDIILNIPDFRSAERAFILLTQVIGRAGRRKEKGRAVIQTYLPGHYAIVKAAKQDFKEFYKIELEKRKAFHYPPFTRLGRAVVRGLKKEVVHEFAQDLKKFLQPLSAHGKEQQVLGPVSCPMEKLNNQYRYHIIIKSNGIQRINQTLQSVKEFFQQHKHANRLHLELDIDPMNLV